MTKIAITGISALNSLGHDALSSFEAICKGECGIDNITLFDTEKSVVKIAGEVKNFDPKEVLSAKDVKKASRFIQLGLKAAKDAFEDSGIKDSPDVDYDKFGISCATGIGGLIDIEKNSKLALTKGPKRLSPFFIPSSLPNMIAGFVSIDYNLKGPNLSSSTACAAGVHAITEAIKTISIGVADKMMVVGAESVICEVGIGGFASMKALSTRNDEPKKASRPFDKDRDGFVMGEGASAIILEKYDDAKKRGAKIYAVVSGFGESGDANHITTPAPQGEGAFRAMKMATSMANLSDISQIGYINAHGTSTKYNDWYETMAIKSLYGNSAIPPISSTKGQIGHCLGAAGILESVIAILAMNKGILPPTINQDTKDEDCDLDYIPNKAIEKEVSTVMTNSFGFGGTNGVLIFSKA